MLEIKNTKVYDLKESVIACRNAMRLDMPEYSDEEFEKGLDRAKKLVQASKNSDNVKCHDNFLTGIRVSFDLKYTQYITKQFQRYHWFDYVSSSSLMHRITKMDFNKCCNKYVSQEVINFINSKIQQYNDINSIEHWNEDREMIFHLRGGDVHAYTKQDALYYAWMEVVSNCPMGTELFVRVSTNYKQLQTIYFQRSHHKLKEDWGEFCRWIKELPYAKELILGDDNKE